MSFLSNKYKLDVKAYEAQVAKFVSHTNTANIKLAGNNSNLGYTVLGHRDTSNLYIAVGDNDIVAFNSCNINFYKDTVIRGNLVIDGYVATLGIDIVFMQDDLFGYIDITSNLLMPKYMNIANTRVSRTSNVIMQMIAQLSEQLFIDGYDVVNSNAETIEFLKHNCNYTIDRFENRFNSKTADHLADGIYNHYFVNNKYLHNMLTVQDTLWASNIYSAHSISASSVYAGEYYADGSKLQNIIVGDGTINSVKEGSNLFFRAEYMHDLLQSCNVDASNYVASILHTNYSHNVFLPTDIYQTIDGGMIDTSNYTCDAYAKFDYNRLTENVNDTCNYVLYNDLAISNCIVYMHDTYVHTGFDDQYGYVLHAVIDASNFITDTSIELQNKLNNAHQMLLQNAENVFRQLSGYIYNIYDNYSNEALLVYSYASNNIEHSYNSISAYLTASSNQMIADTDTRFVNCSNNVFDSSNILVAYLELVIADQNDNTSIISTEITQASYDSDAVTSNYIQNYDMMLSYFSAEMNTKTAQHIDDCSSFLLMSSNSLVEDINKKYAEVSNYDMYHMSMLLKDLDDTSKMVSDYTSNLCNEKRESLYSKIGGLYTEDIADGTSNFFYTDSKFSELFATLSNDNIAEGSVNRWIIDGVYDSDLHILGTLYVSNLVIDGVYDEISTINTNTYQSGSCTIVSSNAGNLLQVFGGTNDIFICYDKDGGNILTVHNDGVTINKTLHAYDLDIAGKLFANMFEGQADGMFNVNISDLNTDQLIEGSNLYITDDRVGLLIDFSNVNISNYMRLVSNYTIINSDAFTVTKEYTILQSNYLYDMSTTLENDASNYLYQMSNSFMKDVFRADRHLSNYLQETSNILIIDHIVYTDTRMSNYIRQSSSELIYSLNSYEYDHSNLITTTGQEMNEYDLSHAQNSCNYMKAACNLLLVKFDETMLTRHQSNYMIVTCNLLYDDAMRVNWGLEHFMSDTSNKLMHSINSGNRTMNSYIEGTSNELMTHAYNMLSNLNLVTNMYTVTDLYGGDKILHLNFKDVKIMNNMDNSQFMLYNNNKRVSLYNEIDSVTSLNTYYSHYNVANANTLYSSSNVYIYNTNDADNKALLNNMNKGFVIHFIFKADFTQNTPIYYIGSDTVCIINIKILYGYLYVGVGYDKNSVAIFSKDVMLPKTWYIVDIVVYIVGGEISFKLFLNAVPHDIVIGNSTTGEIQSAMYNNKLKYVNLIVVCNPLLLPIYLSGNTYYMVFDNADVIYDVTFAKNVRCKILMIGGGGGGGYNYGGGGGSGAYYYNLDYVFTAGEYKFKVGAGGSGSTSLTPAMNGGDTVISFRNADILCCKGGGYGGNGDNFAGGAGGCGGGGLGWNNNFLGERVYAGGSTNNEGTVGMGYSGGSGFNSFTKNILSGGGGGGIGSAGQSASALQKEGGNGGDGLVFNIRGIDEVFGGGGGGGEWSTFTSSPAGLGGGANLNGKYIRVGGKAGRNEGEAGVNGLANTGSGGGSGKNAVGGSGGSGIIILQFSEDNDINMILGCSNLFDTHEDNQEYVSGFVYTNTYYSSNSYTGPEIASILRDYATSYDSFNALIQTSYVYDYQYSSNCLHLDGGFYDDADYRLAIGNRSIVDIDAILTEVVANVRFASGYYYFGLDLMNEISADLLIGKHTDDNIDDYFNVAHYYNNSVEAVNITSNQVSAYPIYIPEGYYRFYLRMLRSVEHRNNGYIIPRYHYFDVWDGASYNLNKNHDIHYVSYASLDLLDAKNDFNFLINMNALTSTSNLYVYSDNIRVWNFRYDIAHSNNVFFAGNRYHSCNVLNLQDMKIISNPLTTSTDHYIKNVLYNGNDKDIISTFYKLKTNRWREDVQNTWIYYNEGNIGIGNTIPYNASLDIHTNTLVNYDTSTIYSMKTNRGIWTNLGIITSSDERIKKGMQDVDDRYALERILEIEPKMYNYVQDDGEKSPVYGFIAQQVAEVIPNAVRKCNSFLPNIYRKGVITDDIICITENVEEKMIRYVKKYDSILLWDAKKERVVYQIDHIWYEYGLVDCIKIKVIGVIRHVINDIDDTELFVYGTEVEDFHVLDKSYIYSLNVGAIQELHRCYERIGSNIEMLYDYENTLRAYIGNLSSNIESLECEQINLDYHLINDVQLLKEKNYEFVQRMRTYNYDTYADAKKELEAIEEENIRLLSSNLLLTEEYEMLSDCINIQMNEITTIKTILSLKNIL